MGRMTILTSKIVDGSIGIPGSNLWRYVSTIFLAIFCADIPLHRPYIW